MTGIAIVGMACRYPDATSPRELWENAIAGRRAFRRLPDVRMRLEDYYDPDPSTPDSFYARMAAVIEGYEFDRIAYKVAGSTYRSTDLTHWLALDMAARALADAGFPMAEGLPRERTGVIVGNSLTGEFSRANQLRLRWPFVRRMVAAALKEQDWDDEQLTNFLDDFEATFKSPFPEIDEDTLAGGLSNTIAGRICNHFDLKGGGYTVDGACSSSLLSVATACKGLVDGELDVVVAGGVDLSIDPFEIIGFAKTSALATGEMRVYDRGSNGFWPGEGCGMVVLMRAKEARKAGHRIYATIAGWGVSSDGKGGITRPEVSGYQLALRRAYDRAGFGIDTVAMFEGHGTGTKVGDSTELTALALARQAAGATQPAAISSIKAMIGHTKAAAGVAGLIKAAMAVYHETLPPTIGCPEPHEIFQEHKDSLRVLRKAEPWPAGEPLRAGITSMGFGGINTHIVVVNDRPRRSRTFDTRAKALASSIQDSELLLADAPTPNELRERLEQLGAFVPSLAYAQLADLASTLHHQLRDAPFRAAVVVSSPEDAVRRIAELCEKLEAGETSYFSPDGRGFIGHASGPGRIGFLFPGQGSGRGTSGGALRRRFAEVEEIYLNAALPVTGDMVATEVAQPRIVTGTLAGLRILSILGIEATIAVGHSLGEISALHWAGAIDSDALLRIATVRGRAMSEHSASGTMASVAAPPEQVSAVLIGLPVVIAGYNGPMQTVIAGPVDAVHQATLRATEAGLATSKLPVSHAFHSPMVQPAAASFGAALESETFQPIERRVVSTVTGEQLAPETCVPALLHRQITDPVLFSQAVALARKDVDLFIEVGPGRVLTGLATAATDVPSVALDTDDESIAGVLRVAGAAWIVGAASVDAALFHGRLTRPLDLSAKFKFFASPCESAPAIGLRPAVRKASPAQPSDEGDSSQSTMDLIVRLASERAELPLELVRSDSRLLDDLHLSSITVGQIVNQVAQRRGLQPAQSPTNFATATVQELADALDALSQTATGEAPVAAAAGAAAWVRAWRMDLDEQPLPHARPESGSGTWRIYAYGDHPLCEPLRRALESANIKPGVLVCLPEGCTEEHLELALIGAKAALSGAAGDRFVVVQHDKGAAGLAKTLSLEAPRIRTTIVHTPCVPEAVGWIVAEVAATAKFSEAFYDKTGTRRVPVMRAMPLEPATTIDALTDRDVLLVTGGGKGITAECALAMAADSGAKLALLGRSDPADDAELSANLRRIADAGVTFSYARADVTDAKQVAEAIRTLSENLGPVTAVLHGAGRNEPSGLANLDTAAFARTFAPKIGGLKSVLDAVGPENLRLLVTLGSIIGRAGLRGEAHYATANDWLATFTREIGQNYPNCRSLCLEWSVWSGVGMGERLSVVESLTRDGVIPISPDQGVHMLRRLLSDPQTPPVVVISGRTESIDTVRYDTPQLPLLRFTEKALVRYHGVELVTEVSLNAGTDLYLADHSLDGNLLFPAVFGLEAMTQVACAMTGRTGPVTIQDAEFLRPIVVAPGGATVIRIAAVLSTNDSAHVVIRSAETGFAAEHFRARVSWCDGAVSEGKPEQVAPGLRDVPLDPMADLYNGTLFQGARFQRLRRYHRAAARDVDADLAVTGVSWFASYLPGQLLLGDPGVRDALMHGNQVCVPDATLLPVGIDRVHPAGPRLDAETEVRYCATERSRHGDTYVYDVALRLGTGQVVERWDGLRLQAVRKLDGLGPWVAPLLGPYLERTVGDLVGTDVAVAVEPDDGVTRNAAKRRARTALALGRALGGKTKVRYRPDGKPEVSGGRHVSVSHGAGLTMAVAGSGHVGCDVETAEPRERTVWGRLLGAHEALAELVSQREPFDTAATRVWAVTECLQKAGLAVQGPLTILATPRPGWVIFSSGSSKIATLATTLRDVTHPVVFAVLVGGW